MKAYTCLFQGLKTTLRVMDEECPREESSISNRQLLVKELHIEKIMKKNKVSRGKDLTLSCFVRKTAFANAKTKVQISCAETVQLITAFVYRYMDSTFLYFQTSNICGCTARFVLELVGIKLRDSVSYDKAYL